MYIEVFFFLLLLPANYEGSFDYPSKSFPLATASVFLPPTAFEHASVFLEAPFRLSAARLPGASAAWEAASRAAQ